MIVSVTNNQVYILVPEITRVPNIHESFERDTKSKWFLEYVITDLQLLSFVRQL